MAEYIKTEVIQYKRLYYRSMNQLQTVTNEDYQNRSEAYVQLISSRNKLKWLQLFRVICREIEEELSHLVEENPGVLTLSQIDSVKDSINKLDRELDLLKQVLLQMDIEYVGPPNSNRNSRMWEWLRTL